VLIVGGGVAGLSLNLALREGPWEVELAERGTGWDQPGAGLAVQPNAMRALGCLGVGAAVERAGVVISRFDITTSTAICCATSTSAACGPRWARSWESAGRPCTTCCGRAGTAAAWAWR
jgi:2-polyprenyl-6-methoxyphenol hydroxylase-like FAD-dependent oxidoreductase